MTWTVLTPVAGTWSGIVSELRTTYRYKATFSVGDSARAGDTAGTSDHDGTGFALPFNLRCGGNLKFRSAEQGSFFFVEKITSGENCVDNGSRQAPNARANGPGRASTRAQTNASAVPAVASPLSDSAACSSWSNRSRNR